MKAEKKIETTLADRVRYLAEQVGGISALSRLSQSSRTILQSVVAGGPASRKTIAAIASATGASMSWLEEGEGKPPRIDPHRIAEVRGRSVADMAPTGLRRASQGRGGPTPRGILEGLARRVQEALDEAEGSDLRAVIPAHLLVSLRSGLVVPGPAFLGTIAAATGKSERWLLTGEE
jgi:hypothetical protein